MSNDLRSSKDVPRCLLSSSTRRMWIAHSLLVVSILLSNSCARSETEGSNAEPPIETANKKKSAGKKTFTPEQIQELLKQAEDPFAQSPAGSTPETQRTGEEWAQFLGPRQNGVSGETGLLTSWPEKGPPVLWEMETGTGYSSPSVRGNSLILHHRVNNEEVVECFTADTGKRVWKFGYPSRFRDPYGYNNGPRCAPILTKTRCYTFGAEGKLLCLDVEKGEKIWMVDTAGEWEIPEAFFGVGSTPILVGQVLFVMVGGNPQAGVVAFHAETGEVLWHSVTKQSLKPTDNTYDLDDKIASYSSLVLAQIHGRSHLLAFLRDGLVSLDPVTGRENFTYFFRSRTYESVNAASPLVEDDSILLSAAYRTGAAFLRVKPNGTEFDVIWKNRNLETHWSTPLPLKGHALGFSGRHENEGMLRCIKLEDGEVIWETDGLPKSDSAKLAADSEAYFGRGSAILADGKIIVLGERGVLALVAADTGKFQEISRIKYPRMVYPSWAAPVLSRQRLYLRCEGYLMCLDLRDSAKSP